MTWGCHLIDTKSAEGRPMINILIIDPNKPFRQSLKKLLLKHFPHVAVDVTGSGPEGMRKINATLPNLILLEIHLPGNSGLDLAAQIKSMHSDAVIAMLTSDNSPEYEAAVKKAGIEHLIPKNEWTGDDIARLIQSIVSNTGNYTEAKLKS
jgi:DNA-binding NarL/FixJ family response regulator